MPKVQCEGCKGAIRIGSCPSSFILLDGEVWQRQVFTNLDYEFCPDCNVEQGMIHHADCDWERCPKCASQLLSCEHGTYVMNPNVKPSPATYLTPRDMVRFVGNFK